MRRLVATLVAVVGVGAAACSGSGTGGVTVPEPATTTAGGAAESTTSTLASPPNVLPRFPAGKLSPGAHRSGSFAFPFLMTLPPGPWSTNGETETVIHLLQTDPPDVGSGAAYDWPGIVLLAFPDVDDQALAAALDAMPELQATASEPVDLDERQAVRVDATSADNPELVFPGSSETFAGLGGYWFWDPEVGPVGYRIYLVDMAPGAMLVWFSAPAASFDELVGVATSAIESIEFTT